MKTIGRQVGLFAVGGVGYGLIEILWRGFTHWSMAVTGGLCFSLLYRMCGRMRACCRWKKCLAGSALITGVEFLVGCFVNLRMHWNVWDYSKMPANLLGQICLPFTALWFLLCAPVTALCDKIGQEK